MKQVSPETLRAILNDFGGIPMSDEELARVAPVVAAFVAEFSRLDELDLNDVDSALQMRADAGEVARDGWVAGDAFDRRQQPIGDHAERRYNHRRRPRYTLPRDGHAARASILR